MADRRRVSATCTVTLGKTREVMPGPGPRGKAFRQDAAACGGSQGQSTAGVRRPEWERIHDWCATLSFSTFLG